MHGAHVAALLDRLGDLLDAVAAALQHHHLDGAALGLGLQEIIDELLVVGRAGVDEHELLLRGHAGAWLIEGKAGLGGRVFLIADGDAHRRGIHHGDHGRGRGRHVAAEEPRLGEHAGQVRREQQTRLELLHEGPVYRRLRWRDLLHRFSVSLQPPSPKVV